MIVKVSDGIPGGRVLEVDYPFGETVAEMLDLFGEEVVKNNALAKMKIALQDLCRPLMKGEAQLPDADILAKVAEWKPGVSRRGGPKKTPAEKLNDYLTDLYEKADEGVEGAAELLEAEVAKIKASIKKRKS